MYPMYVSLCPLVKLHIAITYFAIQIQYDIIHNLVIKDIHFNLYILHDFITKDQIISLFSNNTYFERFVAGAKQLFKKKDSLQPNINKHKK